MVAYIAGRDARANDVEFDEGAEEKQDGVVVVHAFGVLARFDGGLWHSLCEEDCRREVVS